MHIGPSKAGVLTEPKGWLMLLLVLMCLFRVVFADGEVPLMQQIGRSTDLEFRPRREAFLQPPGGAGAVLTPSQR